MISLEYSAEVLLIGKAILIAILGVFLGFISKVIIKKIVDKNILKKIFKEPHTYDVVSVINSVFAEALQWIIIIGFLNHSLTMLGFNFLSIGLAYIITNIPRIAGFVLIISAGLIISKIITARIQEQDIENKNEITTLTELIIIAAFFLTSLEFIGITATALVELYKVILYIIGAILILILVKPGIFEKKTKKSKK